ncbi:hypothetical protein KIL84_015412 [Mauremys mutica]|uniref:Uncharacterized protein n=1 Tax=Mauremys mutica TaxID=74926 RepID=A0A9D3WT36_9SAUR|nr:hypothetical protein KIL84_015412 [Mauremys mutica]
MGRARGAFVLPLPVLFVENSALFAGLPFATHPPLRRRGSQELEITKHMQEVASEAGPSSGCRREKRQLLLNAEFLHCAGLGLYCTEGVAAPPATSHSVAMRIVDPSATNAQTLLLDVTETLRELLTA